MRRWAWMALAFAAACDGGDPDSGATAFVPLGASAVGESCASSADCAGTLRCVALECVDEGIDAPGAGPDAGADVEPDAGPEDAADGTDVGVDAAAEDAEQSDADASGGGDVEGPPCGDDDWCNYAECHDEEQRPTDPDCNPAIMALGDPAYPDWDWKCKCNRWGGLCEGNSCLGPCECDTDCRQGVQPCGADDYCDQHCEEGDDADCQPGAGGLLCI